MSTDPSERSPGAASRRAARHIVELACELVTPYDDAPRLCWASDLATGGIWLEHEPLFVPRDEPLVVCFQPAAGWRGPELVLFARVARISPGRRASDVRGPGIGLAFVDLRAAEENVLARWLAPRPRGDAPPEPPRRPFAAPAGTLHPFAARVS
jgi:hypothetical protein